MSNENTTPEANDDITIEELDEVAGGGISSFSTAGCPVSSLTSLVPSAK